jgi:hypothetical protein
MGRLIRRCAIGLAVVFVAIQLVPVTRSNPPVEEEAPASDAVRGVLRRACYDCHSNETQWPWYGRLAPVSWLLARDVREGREAVNYSTWNRLDAKQRAKALKESWEEIEEGEMPPWFYLPAHPSARLSEQDRTLLRDWSRSAGADR